MIKRLFVTVVALGVTARALALRGNRLQVANTRAIIDSMYATADRLVVVPAGLLDDLCEVALRVAMTLPDPDPLRSAVVGSVASVRAQALPEP